jgi:cytochrome c553
MGRAGLYRWIVVGCAAASVALFAALALHWGRPLYVWFSAESILDQRYTLPRSLVRADLSPEGIARGARLVRLAGCTGCHGPDLRGRRLSRPIAIWANNLRVLTRTYADEDLDRAIRRGLRPDASSLWVMPSQAYLYMRDADVAAILGYLRALRPEGKPTPPPKFAAAARAKILSGELQPIAERAQTQMPAIDIGPHYSGGRYIAMFACGVCHGTELTGSTDGRAPDLKITTRYTRAQFFNLMRKGWSWNERRLKVMAPLAKQRFHILADWEIAPLYEYLVARAKLSPHTAKAPQLFSR